MANLFKEFDAVSAKAWKQKIQADLRGADYNQTLVWESLEGIKIAPFYHLDNLKQLPVKLEPRPYAICEHIRISDEKKARDEAQKALVDGANALLFSADKPFNASALLLDLPKEKNGKKIELQFNLSFLNKDFFKSLIKQLMGYNYSLNIDVIGRLAATGNWFENQEKDYKIVEDILKKADKNANTLGVNVALYQNAGANAVQQVAYALGHGNMYLDYFNINAIQFQFAAGSNYFFEIAKLRAFRYLWSLLLKEYGFKPKTRLFVSPGTRNKTALDPYVNMLRTTSECMSAVLGGADIIANRPYDAFLNKAHDFGQRIANNQLLILIEESGFNPGNNFADGSYYLETLTTQIAEKALELFNHIEDNGGFLKQLLSGTIQRKINESAAKEQQLFDDEKLVLVGTNKYTKGAEIPDDFTSASAQNDKENRKTIIEPVIPKRLSEKVERELFLKMKQ
ncbi:MAG: methylmalonyl-CoA mutase [Flavobacteriales bacterium]|nr:MAG: methylmalonyl-CoA mutase [Flavobacteriales bacterium]